MRRDEANARAAEEAEEQRMQEVDAARRLAILRGETPPALEDELEQAALAEEESRSGTPTLMGVGRRPRKRQGEDDTDFELRVAKERSEVAHRAAVEARQSTSAAPIVDRRGNIDLFGGDEKSRAHAEKNEDAERDAERKKRSYEDQYTMRFANAAGSGSALAEKPRYSGGAQQTGESTQQVMKNVWGRDDPRRKERDEKRIVASDPLAMMRQGAAKVRELKKERNMEREEREADLRQMRREDDRKERHRRSSRRRSRSPGSRSSHRDGDSHSRHRHRNRDGSSHGDGGGGGDRERRHRHRDDRRHRHRSRSRDRDGHRRHRGDDEKRHK